MAELFAEQAAVPGEQHGRGRRVGHVVVAGGEARLTSRDRAMAVAALGATSRWLALIAGWLAEQGAEPVAVGLVEAARQDVAEVCNKLSPTTSAGTGATSPGLPVDPHRASTPQCRWQPQADRSADAKARAYLFNNVEPDARSVASMAGSTRNRTAFWLRSSTGWTGWCRRMPTWTRDCCWRAQPVSSMLT